MDIKVTTKEKVICVSHKDGINGKSAYQQAVEGGYTGTEQEFNLSLSLLADVAEGKKQIADAINTKGGNSNENESFAKLAEDIQTLPTSGILANGVEQTEPFSFLKYITTEINNEITEINDSEITTITRPSAFYKNVALREVVMSGITTISKDSTFDGCSSLQTAYFTNLATISSGATFNNCSALQIVRMPNLVIISGGSTFFYCTSLQRVEFPNLTTISGVSTFYNCTSLQNVQLPNLATISANNTFYGCSLLQSIDLPNLTIISAGYTFFNCYSLQSIVFGTLIQCVDPLTNVKQNIRNITIGQDTDITLPFQNWTATNVINEGQSGIDELNSNLRTNLLEKLADHSEDGQTRTLRLGWLAKVTQENIDYANAKGWTLTT